MIILLIIKWNMVFRGEYETLAYKSNKKKKKKKKKMLLMYPDINETIKFSFHIVSYKSKNKIKKYQQWF